MNVLLLGEGVAVVLDEILVVGAGPVGLIVSIELWRRGGPCRVIDPLVESPQYAKAVGIAPGMLEVGENLAAARREREQEGRIGYLVGNGPGGSATHSSGTKKRGALCDDSGS